MTDKFKTTRSQEREVCILITTPYFYPKTGGLENYAKHIAEGLADLGYRVVVVCGDLKVQKITRQKYKKLIIYRLPVKKIMSNTPINFGWVKMLKDIIKTEKPDVINAHTPVPFMVEVSAWCAGKIPLLITYHASTLKKQSGLVFKIITKCYLILQWFTFKKATRLIAVSNYVKQQFTKTAQTKTLVICNAIDQVDKPKSKVGKGFVFINNLEFSHAWKGLDLILDALMICGLKAPKLNVIGDGSMRDYYEKRVNKQKLSKFVSFKGELLDEQKIKTIRSSQALLIYPTSANDAFPTVLLEAWASGLAVIGAAIGPIPSLITDGVDGVLVKPNDPKSLALALMNLNQKPLKCLKLGDSGRQKTAAKYLWPNSVAKMAEAIEAVL